MQRLSCFLQHRGTERVERRKDHNRKIRLKSDRLTPAEVHSSNRAISKSAQNHDAEPIENVLNPGYHELRFEHTDAAIIFDESRSKSVYDTLIKARGKGEAVFDHSQFSILNKEFQDVKPNAEFYPKFVQNILDVVFSHLIDSWDGMLDL